MTTSTTTGSTRSTGSTGQPVGPSMLLGDGLHEALKALKLTGMLSTLDDRLAQARAGDLGHLEFLQVLAEDELARRQSVALTRRLARARFEAGATLEGFDYTANPKLPPPRSATWPPYAGSPTASPSSCSDRSGSGKPMSHRASGTPLSAAASTSGSPRPAGCSPTSPAATPTGPGTDAYATTPAPACSSWTTSRCAS
jgi:hypothetical protein